jgi:hypothetical protein
MRACLLLAFSLLAPIFRCQAEPITFPAGYVPFTFLDYMTVPDSNGYSLVVGEATAPGALQALVEYLRSLQAESGNQQYADEPIELAPGLFFNNVLVPTSSEVQGDFRDFGGLLYDPASGSLSGVPTQFAVNYNLAPGRYTPFAMSIIPMSVYGELFAFRIGPDDPASAVPEPGGLLPFAFGIATLLVGRATFEKSS